MLDAILFDLDGTLLPMNMEEFTSGYFNDLSNSVSSFNIPKEKLIKTIWAGTHAMAKNDGSCKNMEAFWNKFYELIPEAKGTGIDKACDRFYSHEFLNSKRFTQDNPLAVEAVKLARTKAKKVILATNPLFPMVGQITRLSWIGLKVEDFDLVTSYESDSYCKPNPMYFASVCEREGLNPANCLMIGNDEYEDMYACTKVGIKGYLVTDTAIKSEEHPWNGEKGSFAEFIEKLKKMK